MPASIGQTGIWKPPLNTAFADRNGDSDLTDWRGGRNCEIVNIFSFVEGKQTIFVLLAELIAMAIQKNVNVNQFYLLMWIFINISIWANIDDVFMNIYMGQDKDLC